MPITTASNSCGSDKSASSAPTPSESRTAIAERALKWVNGCLAGSIAMAVACHILAKLFIHKAFWICFFDLKCEQNFPTWVATVLWLLVAQTSIAAYFLDGQIRPGDKSNRIWLFIAAAFTFASLDDTAMIHEHLYATVHHVTVHWQIFYLPGMLLTVVLGGAFLWRRFAPFARYRLFLVGTLLLFTLALSLECLQQDNYIFLLMMHHSLLGTTELCWFVEEVVELIGTALIVSSISGYVLKNWALSKSE